MQSQQSILYLILDISNGTVLVLVSVNKEKTEKGLISSILIKKRLMFHDNDNKISIASSLNSIKLFALP